MKKLLMAFVFMAGALGAWPSWPWSKKVVEKPIEPRGSVDRRVAWGEGHSPIPVDEIRRAPIEHAAHLRVKKSANNNEAYGYRPEVVVHGASSLSREVDFRRSDADDRASLSQRGRALGAHRGKGRPGGTRLRTVYPVDHAVDDTSDTSRSASMSPRHPRSPRH